MHKRFIIGTAVLLTALGGYLIFNFAWVSSWDVANLPPKNDTIVAFGDSLVEGVGSTDGNDFVSLLSMRTGKAIINAGRSGETTRSALERLDEVLAYDPGVVIVVLGGNDALRKLPIQETTENLKAILERLNKNGSVVVLVGVRGALFDDPYDEMYEELARDEGALLVPNALEGIFLRPALTEDQIHPNDAGYLLVAERIYEVIEPLYK